MDENEFWALIDRSREADAEQEETLEQLFTGRSRDELEAFDRIYREQPRRLRGGARRSRVARRRGRGLRPA